MKKNICSNLTQREEMFRTSVMPASQRGSVRKTPLCYLLKGTTARLPHFSSQQPWGFSQKSWKCARETPPQKTIAYAAVSASLQETEHGSLTDRWRATHATNGQKLHLQMSGSGASLQHCTQIFSSLDPTLPMEF